MGTSLTRDFTLLKIHFGLSIEEGRISEDVSILVKESFCNKFQRHLHACRSCSHSQVQVSDWENLNFYPPGHWITFKWKSITARHTLFCPVALLPSPFWPYNSSLEMPHVWKNHTYRTEKVKPSKVFLFPETMRWLLPDLNLKLLLFFLFQETQ